MSFTPEQLRDAVRRARARRDLRAKKHDLTVEDLRSDLALLAAPEHQRHVAEQLVLAERAGIRSVWTHGLWSFEDGEWIPQL